MERLRTALAPGLALALHASAAAADPMTCFARFAAPSSLATNVATATTMPVTLATTFRSSPGCVYGLSPDVARMTAVPERELDFAELAEQLTRGSPAAPVHTIYARPTAGGRVESIFRESCTDVIFSDGLAFDARVDTSTRLLHVARRDGGAAGDCGASRVVLRFVPLAGDGEPALLARVPADAERDLGTDRREVILGAPGRFAVYAARPSPPGEPRPALLVGRLSLDSPLTALRRAMSTAARDDAPWFRPTWRDDRFVFARSTGIDDESLWHEVVLAASSEQLWLTDAPTSPADLHPRVHGPLQVTAARDGFVLPGGLVEGAMRARYGAAGAVMAPTVREWESLRRGLQVCVAERYARTRADGSPARLPSDSRCARLASVSPEVAAPADGTPPATPDAEPAAPAPRQLCLARHQWRITARGMERERPLAAQCFPLTGATPEGLPLASVGDRAAIEGGTGSGLSLCIENHCRALPTEPAPNGIRLWRAGLAELRRAQTAEGATSRETVTLARFVVIDPLTDFHPAGVATGAPIPAMADPEGEADRADELRPGPWRTVAHDEDNVFAYVRRRNAMRFYFTATPSAAGLWNTADRETVLTAQLPVIGGVQRADVSPPPSGLVVLLSRDGQCPTEPSAGFRARAPADPDGLLVDQTVHAFLARDLGGAAPFECIAHAQFRVREARAMAPTSWLHLGLLGDAQAAFFLAEPFAFGVVYPVGFANARLPAGFFVEGAVAVTAAVNFADGELSRAGAGISLALGWGPLGLAPRLVTVGAMLHLATGSANDNPWVSPYLGINVNTLVDAIGGR